MIETTTHASSQGADQIGDVGPCASWTDTDGNAFGIHEGGGSK